MLNYVIRRKSASNLQVGLGDHDWTTSNEADSFKMSVSQVKMHPNYQQGGSLNNDACLLKLSRPVSFVAIRNVRPICLPETSGNSYANQPAKVAGWGRYGSGNSISTVLRDLRGCKYCVGCSNVSHKRFLSKSQ